MDKTVYEWFQQKRAQNIPLSGPLIQEKALETANSLGISDFKASNGWLDHFKTRHNIIGKLICGERGSVKYLLLSRIYIVYLIYGLCLNE